MLPARLILVRSGVSYIVDKISINEKYQGLAEHDYRRLPAAIGRLSCVSRRASRPTAVRVFTLAGPF